MAREPVDPLDHSGLHSVGDEESDRQNELGRALLNALFVLLRMASMHDLHNDALLRPMQNLHEVLSELQSASGDETILRLADGNFFVNKRLVRLDYGTFQNARYLERIFDFLNINEATFRSTLTPVAMREFAAAVLAIVRAGHGYIEDKEFDDIRLRKMKIGEIGELRQDRDVRNRVLSVYASGLLTLRQFLADIRQGRSLRHIALKRICLEIIDVEPRHHALLLALLHVEAYKGTLFCHMMNTAILSMVFGQRLGLSRRQLVDLGLAAFHHDLGWALLSDARLSEQVDSYGLRMQAINQVRDGQHEDMHRLRTEVARALSRFGGFNEMVIHRLIVAFECQVPGDAPSEGLYFGDAGANFMTQVVRIASAFDEWTTAEGRRPASTPDRALRRIMEEGQQIFSPRLSRLFAQCIGRYPIGTVVELDSAEIALVVDLPSDPVQDHRPQVKILIDRAGHSLADGPVVDLNQRHPGGDRFVRTVERSLDARAFGVNITRFFFGAG